MKDEKEKKVSNQEEDLKKLAKRGKTFDEELMKMNSTAEWADQRDISCISDFMFGQKTQYPLICIGSGGSLSACYYAALLNKLRNGVLSAAMTPLELMYSGANVIRNSKLLFLSASGRNYDIQNAAKAGLKYNETGMMSLTLRDNNPTDQMMKACPNAMHWCEGIPWGRDGFLATNSLLVTFSLLSRSYNGEPVCGDFDFNESYTSNCDIDLATIQNFIVLYGAAGESVAKDIESKLSEAALGSALLSDYRNFGHGRHYWFAKHSEDSCIIALVSPAEKELAKITLGDLPTDTRIIYITSELSLPKASIEMLVKSFRFVRDLGKARNIDPARPGVPSYGRILFSMDYNFLE